MIRIPILHRLDRRRHIRRELKKNDRAFLAARAPTVASRACSPPTAMRNFADSADLVTQSFGATKGEKRCAYCKQGMRMFAPHRN
jgi:hypothetical protein